MISFAKSALLFALVYSCCFLTAQDSAAIKAKIEFTRRFILQQRQAPDYRDSVRESIFAYQKSLGTSCKNVVVDLDSTDVRDTLLDEVESDGKGAVISGSWRESVPGTACEEKRRFNVQVDVTPRGLRYTATFPGEAEGNPELQRDTLNNIETNFQMLRIQVKKSCHVEVIDTHLDGPRPSMQDNGILAPWKESWEVRTCGKVYAVPVTFKSDGKGTFIDVATSDIKAE